MPIHIFLLLLMMGVLEVSGADLGKPCKRDRDCVGSDPNLRCFGKPGFLRCACKHAWRPLAGRCRGPKGEGGGQGEGEGGGGEDLVSILAPGILMGLLVLFLSLFCCFQVHQNLITAYSKW